MTFHGTKTSKEEKNKPVHLYLLYKNEGIYILFMIVWGVGGIFMPVLERITRIHVEEKENGEQIGILENEKYWFLPLKLPLRFLCILD